uniref:G patch domain and KOW motifs-containing protein n=1 Tax=Haliotis diversicolor supertexta TaxID=283615 RepID=E4W3F7_HALDV|nr:G patch domain and KOW motifs-containing protein [Haliotis diversicolor supertexta]
MAQKMRTTNKYQSTSLAWQCSEAWAGRMVKVLVKIRNLFHPQKQY